MKKIKCSIDPKTGEMKILTEGYSGEECLAATKPLEDGLGMNAACTLTEEFYKNAQQSDVQVGGQPE